MPRAREIFQSESVTLVLLVASVVTNLVLANQLRQARQKLEPPPFLSGKLAPEIRLVDVSGGTLSLSYGQGNLPTLIYWFSPSCGWCEVNFPNFQALASQAPGRYRFAAISLAPPGDLAAYASRHHVSFPLYTVKPEVARLYRLNGTPSTVFIAPDGNLVKRWEGAYSPSALGMLEKTLSVTLPGLPSASSEGGTR